MNSKINLNIGCGTDYREGFVNIDGSSSLNKIDKVLDFETDSLLNHFPQNSVDFILANDIVEHQFHWEAVKLMSDFYKLLKVNGKCEIRVPDCEYIINNSEYSVELKLNLLFGGQDIPQGRDIEMDQSRKKFPQYFCHKFGWTMRQMREELNQIGFRNVELKRAQSNFIAVGTK